MALHQAAGALGHLVGVHGALGLLNQAQDVAHAQDAVRHAIRMEEIEVAEPLTGAGEGDGPADHALDRERGTAAGVAVEFGEDDAAQLEGVVEGLGGGHRVLADHGVDDQERVVGLRRGRDGADLLHQLGVDREPARRVDDADVPAQSACLLERRRVRRQRDRSAR